MSRDKARVALIIGAGTTAGAEIARGLAANGVSVALNDLLPTRIEQTANELGEGAQSFAADVSRKLALQTMLHDVLEAYRRIDILVFVASVQPDDTLMDMDEWDWHRSLDLNLTAAFLCMQSVGRVMRELGGGVMVNVVGDVQGPTSNVESRSAAYAIAAAGLEALTAEAKREFAAHKIEVRVAKSAEETIRMFSNNK